MTKEETYDQIVAPLLGQAAKACQEHGFSMIARVEWEPGESGITRIGDPKISVGQAMTWYAAHAHGNVDSMLLALIRNFNCSQSMFLYSHNQIGEDQPK